VVKWEVPNEYGHGSTARTKPEGQNKRPPYAVWHVSEDMVRVQIDDADLARAFSKVNGVHRWLQCRGAFAHIYSTKQSVSWVHNWMKAHRKEGDTE